MNCDVGKETKGLENELWRRWSDGNVGEWVLLSLQTFHNFAYVTAHSPTFISVLVRHRFFTYVTWRAAHGKEIKALHRFPKREISLSFYANCLRHSLLLFFLFRPNDGHLLKLKSETVAVRKRMNYELDYKWWPNDTGGWKWPKFPDICVTVEETPPEKTSTRKLTRPGIEPGPA